MVTLCSKILEYYPALVRNWVLVNLTERDLPLQTDLTHVILAIAYS